VRSAPAEAPIGDRVAGVGNNAGARRQFEKFVGIRVLTVPASTACA
jgi:hypothetical protein